MQNEKLNRRRLLKNTLSFLLSPIVLNKLFLNSLAAQEQKIDKQKRVYTPPKPNERISTKEANFSIFPNKLDFKPGKRTLIISRKWQTAALYEADGSLYRVVDKNESFPLYMQVGTGRPGSETPVGLYKTLDKPVGKLTGKPEDYTSGEFTTTGLVQKDKDGNVLSGQNFAPMPHTQHIKKFKFSQNGKLELDKNSKNGLAIHGRKTVDIKRGTLSQVSRGCVGLDGGVAEYLYQVLSIGDQVMVVDDEIPKVKTLAEVVDFIERTDKITTRDLVPEDGHSNWYEPLTVKRKN